MSALRQTDFRKTAQLLPILGGEQARQNVVSSLERGLPEIQPAFVAHDGHLVIVGSGPSLPGFIEEIKSERGKGRPILAVKGAHDFLVERGIEPDLFLSVEIQDRRHQFKHLPQDTVYLLASRVHPAVFDHLKGRNVVLWHSWANTEIFPELNGKQVIGGGTTSGLRAITVGYVLGFRKFILYGFDSCLDENKKKRFDSGVMKDEQIVDRWIAGRRFLCNHAMALQADEFQELYGVMEGITLDVKGDGLLAAIVAERKRLGYPA